MKPTTIGTPMGTRVDERITTSPLPAVQMNTGAVILRPEQVPVAEDAVSAIDFAQMPSGDVIKIGLDAEQALQRTLDGFLSRLDKKTASSVFALFGRLEQGVEDAKLPEILDKIQNGEKPGMLGSLMGKLRGKRPDELVSDLMAEIGDLISGRTRTLADELSRLEGELSKEMQRLFAELQQLDSLKKSYAVHFSDFTVAAAVSMALLGKARAYVAEEESKLNPADVVEVSRIGELRDKLRLLESRALALEGTYTRLPADQMVIQQIDGEPPGQARQAADRHSRQGAQRCRCDRSADPGRQPLGPSAADRADHCHDQRDPRSGRGGPEKHRGKVRAGPTEVCHRSSGPRRHGV